MDKSRIDRDSAEARELQARRKRAVGDRRTLTGHERPEPAPPTLRVVKGGKR